MQLNLNRIIREHIRLEKETINIGQQEREKYGLNCNIIYLELKVWMLFRINFPSHWIFLRSRLRPSITKIKSRGDNGHP